MTKLTPEEEAETKTRALVAEAHIRDEKHAAFLSRVPELRTSDLFEYLADPDYGSLTATLGLMANEELTEDELTRVLFAAVFAVKDEINRRFPIPTSERATCTTPVENPADARTIGSKDHAPLINHGITRIIGCTCGWRTPSCVTDSDDAFSMHAALTRAAEDVTR